ncbi:hypothetical protein V3C99_015088 [Haemonchus contortus]
MTAVRWLIEMSLTVYTTALIYVVYILPLLLSVTQATQCSRKKALSETVASESTTRESSSSRSIRKHRNVSVKESRDHSERKRAPKVAELPKPKEAPMAPVTAREPPKASVTAREPPKAPVTAREPLPVKSQIRATPMKQREVEKVETAPKRDEGKTLARALARTLKKDGVTEAMTALDTEALKTKPLSLAQTENVPESDPGDGNYEDVNLETGKPEAPKALITIDPLKMTFVAYGGKATFNVLNAGDARTVFKVKCSNNADYRITPAYGFVEAIGMYPISVVRMPGPVKDDKMVVQWGVAPQDATDPILAFKELAPSDVQQITVMFTVVSGVTAAMAQKPSTPAAPPLQEAPKPAVAGAPPVLAPKSVRAPALMMPLAPGPTAAKPTTSPVAVQPLGSVPSPAPIMPADAAKVPAHPPNMK